MAAAMVDNVAGECYVKAEVSQKDWYPKFVISIYSSEIISMQEVDIKCEDV